MVAFFEVITFVGVAAFFGWLEFVPLLNDLAQQSWHSATAKVRSPYSAMFIRRKVKENLVRISDLFLSSFLFNLTAVIVDYFYHNTVWIFSYHLIILLHAPVLYIIIVSFIGAGLMTLLLSILPIRSILRGDRNLLMHTRNISQILFTGHAIVLMFALDWIANMIASDFPYGSIVVVIAGLLTVLGAVMRLKKRRVGIVIMVAPIWVWVTVWVLLYLLHLS